MTTGRDYDQLCPIFNCKTGDGGVLYPLVIPTGSTGYVNLDGADLSTVLGAVRIPYKARIVTCTAYAVPDDQGSKAATASAEPVVTVIHGSSALASVGIGSAVANITCGGAGGSGVTWAPGTSTTPVDVEADDYIGVVLTTQGASATSANEDGGANVIVWLAGLNAP